MKTLTETQVDALSWIDRFPCSQSRWMRNGKEAYGDPAKWDEIEFSGMRGSIRIASGDWTAIRDLIEPADFSTDRMYRLTERGAKKLAEVATIAKTP